MKLHRGINLGGYLSQCNHQSAHYDAFITEGDIEQIAGWGLDHVRLPIDYEVIEQEDGSVKEQGYGYVDRVVAWCEKYHLNLVLDLHKAYGYDFNNAGSEEENNLFTNAAAQERFVALWERIAKRYGKCSHVAFELLNEVVEKENADLWNALIARTVKAIRGITKDTSIIYGGIQWNSVKTLKLLEVPEDENIIFTFHFYEPLLFTHQKAYWVKNMDPVKDVPYPESMDYYKEESKILGYQGEVVTKAASKEMGKPFIREMIQEAIDAAKKANVNLYCGEFGVIDQAPIEDTYRWFHDVNEVFLENDIGCCVWNYKEKDFGISDAHYATIQEQLLNLWRQ